MRINTILLMAILLSGCAPTSDTPVVTPIHEQTLTTETKSCTLPALFGRSDFDWERQTLAFQPYVMDLYSTEAIANLRPGDLFQFNGDTLTIESVVFDNDEVLINRGLDEGGATLQKEGSGHYRGVMWNDYATYTSLDCVTLPLAEHWTLTDCGDDPDTPVTTLTEDQQAYLLSLPDYREDFSPLNTTLEIQEGKIVSITRVWTP